MNATQRPFPIAAFVFWLLSAVVGGLFLWQHTEERLDVLDAYQRFSEPEKGERVQRVFFENDAYAWLRLRARRANQRNLSIRMEGPCWGGGAEGSGAAAKRGGSVILRARAGRRGPRRRRHPQGVRAR